MTYTLFLLQNKLCHYHDITPLDQNTLNILIINIYSHINLTNIKTIPQTVIIITTFSYAQNIIKSFIKKNVKQILFNSK